MRVVVLGAGYAGVTVARRLESTLPDDVELVLVDESDAHLVQHELHRVIRRPGFADDIQVPLDQVVDRASIRRGRVDTVDHEAGVATFADGERLDYDYAAVCLGAETDYHGLDGVAAHATPLKRLPHAREIRSSFLDLCESGGRIVVGGAGLSGVQVAGELHALATEEDARDVVDIVLLERLGTVAPSFPENFQRAVAEELADRNIDVRTNTAVRGATADAIEIDGGTVPSDQFVWTGGIRGPDALGGERLRVRGNLRIGDCTFVVGDTASVIDRDGEAVPASAQTAIAEARVAARNITRLVETDLDEPGQVFEPRLDAYGYDPRGWIVSVGDGAVAQIGPTVLRGRAALALKTTVGVGHLSTVGDVRRAVSFAVDEFGGR